MLKYCKILLVVILVFPQMKDAYANGYVPEVYQDEQVTVRAGIMEVERGPILFGDLLALTIEIVFNSKEARIENLNEEFFRRSWGSEKGISLSAPPEVIVTNPTRDHTVMRSTYLIQILDCPGAFPVCPGSKHYEIPIFTLGYQIIDESGEVVNNRSVRFRPWPGGVAVAQTLHIGEEGLEDFAVYFPSGGYPRPLAIESSADTGAWTALLGGLILIAGFAPLLFANKNVTRRVEISGRSSKRWEQALSILRDQTSSMPDEQWADLMRRCTTWYCIDELHFNPYSWLGDDSKASETSSMTAFRSYFLDLLNQESIEIGRRGDYINRLLVQTGDTRFESQ